VAHRNFADPQPLICIVVNGKPCDRAATDDDADAILTDYSGEDPEFAEGGGGDEPWRACGAGIWGWSPQWGLGARGQSPWWEIRGLQLKALCPFSYKRGAKS